MPLGDSAGGTARKAVGIDVPKKYVAFRAVKVASLEVHRACCLTGTET